MSGKASPEHGKTRRVSLRLYASRVFQESYVSVLSSAVNTSSIRRRIFKVVAFSLCLTGFLYQASVFLSAVFKYPTTLDTVVFRPDNFTVPAYTFCNNNGINKKIFCEKFPEKCEVPLEEFCKKYEGYCGENGTLVPQTKYFNYHEDIEGENLFVLNEELEDFVLENSGSWDWDGRENITGQKGFSDYKRFQCYTVNDRINNELDPPQHTPSRILRLPVHTIQLRVRENETFLPGDRQGVLFALHSPFEAVNPFETGIFMKPGRKYLVFVAMMCRQNCMADISVQCYNCRFPDELYPRPERFCNSTDYEFRKSSCPRDSGELYHQCVTTNCKENCRQVKYNLNVQERFHEHFDKNGLRKEVDDIIDVEIYVEGEQVIQLRHSPKFMFVEAFSNIGGFIGIWLGISLLDITDVFEGLFRVFRYAFKKR